MGKSTVYSTISNAFFDDADRADRGATLAKAVVAEYLAVTLFMFWAIGTISSNCHSTDVFKLSGAPNKSLIGSEQPAVHC